MSDRLNEQLSALLDGELSAGEAELLLRRLDRDAELRGTLSRYTLIGDAVRVTRLEAAGEVATVEPLASAGFASRLAAAIDAEEQRAAAVAAGQGIAVGTAMPFGSPLPAPVRRRGANRWWQPLGGVAVAAGVAGLALMVVQREPVVPSAGPVVAAVQGSPGAAASVLSPAVSPTASPVTSRVTSPINSPVTSPGLVASTEPVFQLSGEPNSYTTPLSSGTGGASPTFIPAAELASYVVAHSEVSGPLARRNVLSGVVAQPLPAAATDVATGTTVVPAAEPARP